MGNQVGNQMRPSPVGGGRSPCVRDETAGKPDSVDG